MNCGSALDQLMQLRVVSFDYKDGHYSKEESSSSVGLIAEEVEKVNPLLVDYGYDGKPLTLHFERLTGLNIQAIQEQRSSIISLSSTTISLSSTTLELASKNKELSDLLNTNLASSSQNNKTLAAAIDSTNAVVNNLNFKLESVASTTAELTSLNAEYGNRLSTLEQDFTGLYSSTTLQTTISSTTQSLIELSMDGIASTTSQNLASSTSFIATISGAVVDLIRTTGEWFVDKLTARVVYTERIETQVAAISQGLEMTDQVTGQIYCVIIKNGNFDKVPGACSAHNISTTTTQIAVQDIEQQNVVDNPPVVIVETDQAAIQDDGKNASTSQETVSDDTASTTDPVPADSSGDSEQDDPPFSDNGQSGEGESVDNENAGSEGSAGTDSGQSGDTPTPTDSSGKTDEPSPESSVEPVAGSAPEPESASEPAPDPDPAPSPAPAPVSSPSESTGGSSETSES